MDWKAKARKHKKWVEAGKDIAETLNKYLGLDTEPVHICYKGERLKVFFDDECAPKCNCKDDGDTQVEIAPCQMKNGEYQLRIVCSLCLGKGKRCLKWDTVGRESVIRIFANYFLREMEHKQFEKESEKELADKTQAGTLWV